MPVVFVCRGNLKEKDKKPSPRFSSSLLFHSYLKERRLQRSFTRGMTYQSNKSTFCLNYCFLTKTIRWWHNFLFLVFIFGNLWLQLPHRQQPLPLDLYLRGDRSCDLQTGNTSSKLVFPAPKTQENTPPGVIPLSTISSYSGSGLSTNTAHKHQLWLTGSWRKKVTISKH